MSGCVHLAMSLVPIGAMTLLPRQWIAPAFPRQHVVICPGVRASALRPTLALPHVPVCRRRPEIPRLSTGLSL
jgi:hypothetical protein